MGWLSSLFNGILKIFSPLKAIAHWKIWHELIQWYDKFKKWRDWFRDHILNPLRKEQQVLQKLKDQFALPVVKLIDHIRQISQIIGIFNRKLAAKLDYVFLKVEGYILTPFNKATQRINALGNALQSVVTALGYLDRGALCNSVWRDAKLIKGILHNPLGNHPSDTAPGTGTTTQNLKDETDQFLDQRSGPLLPGIEKMEAITDAHMVVG